jgi:UDP-2,3-diacylglucosamine hydrolase
MTADGASAGAGNGPLGILAGGGGLPEQIAARTMASGRAVHIVGIAGEAEPGIARFPHTWVNWGAIGRMTAALKSAGARDLIIVGSVTRPDPRKVRPDLGLVRALPTILRLFGGGDDHVLRNVVRFFEAQGFTVRGVADVAPELLMPIGTLGRLPLLAAQAADAARGFALIEALGPADVGQAVVMRDGRALAIEAAEGTDRMLARLADGDGRRARGAVLVKGPKPGQELRVDMPVIGPRTIEHASALGLAGIAVAAGRVLVAERATVIDAADASGLFVAGIDPCGAPVSWSVPKALAPLGRSYPDLRLLDDMTRAAGVATAVAGFADCAGVVVVRRHVIAIDTGEGSAAMFARVRQLRQWGATARSKRRGAAAIGRECTTVTVLETIIAGAAEAGLAGIIAPPQLATDVLDRAGRLAGERGLAMVVAVAPTGGHRP